MPHRPLTTVEGFRVAELQAARLLARQGITCAPVSESVIADLPRVQIERKARLGMSGAVRWVRGRWVILVNGAEPYVRQKFTAAHEAKHMLDAPFGNTPYPPIASTPADERQEQVADHFAACLLMPRPWVKRAWCSGTQDLGELSRQFRVSQQAMRVRLLSLGLVEPAPRCRGVAA